MKHATVWTRLLLGSVTLLLLLPACGGGEKKQEKIEITPYILNLHLKYSFIDNFEDGLARVMMKTKTESGRETGVFGCIDEKGHEVIPCIYESVYMEPGGVLVSPKEGDNKLFVYRDGTLQEFPMPDGLEPQGGFYNGRARVHDEDFNYGYIDTEGNLVVPCRYNSADDFSEGLAVVEQNWRKGYIDVDGNEVTPLIYCNAMEFYNGLGCVQNEEGNRLDSNGLETPDAASASASAGSDASAGSSAAGGSGVVVVPSVSAPASTGSSQSDPVRRVEWEIRRNRAIEELARLQVKLIEDPNSAYIKHNIQTQQNIINTCNEMIAIYQ